MISATIDVPSAGTRDSKAMLWTGRILWVLVVPFFLMDCVMHLVNPPFVVEASQKMGFGPSVAPILGIVELLAIALYILPRSATLGAILFTGYLGGAVATHVRAGGNFGIAVVMGVLVWGSLYCRNERVRALFS